MRLGFMGSEACRSIESYDWKDPACIESIARQMARAFRDEKSRLKRIFSALATCTSAHEARSVLSFHYYRLMDRRQAEACQLLEKLFRSWSGLSDEEFRSRVLPKLRPLYNFTMYYITAHRAQRLAP